MVSAISCPDEADLLPLASGEPADPRIKSHVEVCAICAERVQALKGELENLKNVFGQLPADWTSQSPFHSTVVDPATKPAIKLPARIGRYIVLQVLGEGGQATVFRGVHPLLSREVVVKLGKHAIGDEATKHRLVQEGQTLASLDHPHLARIHDLDFHEDRPFLVLDYFPGKNLAQYAEDQRLSARKSAGIVARICRAVEAAHARGIAHKDLKPDNVVVDAKGEPHVIDFGMAHVRDAWSSAPLPAEFTAGTPAYIAPERLQGESGRGLSGDVFGLGGILYYLLTGHAPFEAEDLDQTLQLAAQGEFNRERLKRPGIPKRLAENCQKALEPDPEKRIPSAGQLAEELERFARPRRAGAWIGGVLGALLLLWILSGSFKGETPPADDPPVPLLAAPEFSVKVRGPGFSHELLGPAPLEQPALKAGQRLRISGKVPPGYHVALFLFTADGKVQRLSEMDVRKSPGVWEIVVPPEGQELVVQGQPGTDVLLICGSRHEISESQMASLKGTALPWPELPTFSSVQFDAERSWITGSRSFLTRTAPEKPALDRAESLRPSLAEEFDNVRGVALPHNEE
jgi:tRNA A-37 threonylcarbamoyl transferase component Bud32